MTTPKPDQHDTLAAALAAFQTNMPSVHKGKTATVPTKNGGSYRYTYADLADVSKAALPLLSQHGLSFTTHPRHNPETRAYELMGVLRHVSGETTEGALPLFGNSAQELGSALTYARRYLLGCMTGVVTDDDDDGNTAQAAGSSRHVPPPPTVVAEEPDERLSLINEIGMLAGGYRQEVLDKWAAEHDGEHIKDAKDLDELRSLRDEWAEKVKP